MNLFSSKYFPLTIVIAFNLFTLLIFLSAPIIWKTNNLIIFFCFSLICQLMIILGYILGYNKYFKKNSLNPIIAKLTTKNINFIFIAYFLTFLIKYAYLLRFDVLDIKGMVKFLLIGIADPQAGYHLAIESSRPYTVSWSIYFFTSIINQVFFISGFILWRDINRVKKIIFVLFLFIEIFYWMGRGTNFGVIAMITTLGFSLFFRLKSVRVKLKNMQNIKEFFLNNKSRIFRIVLLLAVFFVITSYINGRSLYKERTKLLQSQSSVLLK